MPGVITVELSQYLTSVFLALGGSLGITLIILALFKQTLQKWINTAIERSSEQVIVTLTNDLQRRTSAYNKILEKELEYYDTAATDLTNILTSANLITICDRPDPSLQESHQRVNRAKSDAIYSATKNFECSLFLYRCYYPNALFQKGEIVLQACRPFLSLSPRHSDLESLRSACAEFMSEIKERLILLSQ